MNIQGLRKINRGVLPLISLLLIVPARGVAWAASAADFDDAVTPATAEISLPKPIKPVTMDLWSYKKVRPYILLMHTGTIYPRKAFILVRKKDKGADPSRLRATICKRLKTEIFRDAAIIPMEDFFPDVLEKHREHKMRIQRDLAQTLSWFEKDKIKAVAVRLGENEATEAIYRP